MGIEVILYLINLIKNIDLFFSVIIGVSILIILFCLFISLIILSDEAGEWPRTPIYKIRKYIIIVPIIILISCIFPSEKTMYMMIGSHYLKASTIPSKVEQVINKKLDEYLSQDIKKK